MINDPYLQDLNKQDITCFQNPFTYCCLKNKKPFKFAQTQQNELYPLEWDPLPISKNKDTEVEDKNLNTQGIDQTRDEANMSNANPSPSPRADGMSPVHVNSQVLDRENSEIIYNQ